MTNKKKIGLLTCITILVGSMVGSAVFSLSGLTVFQAGPAALLSWIMAGLIMLCYGLICTELSSVFPKSGGVYVFPAKAFSSKFLGWMSGWGFIAANIIAVSFSAIYVSIYLGAGFGLDSSYQVPLAIMSIAFCLAINSINILTAGKLNSFLVCGLVVSLLIYICVSFFSGKWEASYFVPFFTQGSEGTFGFLKSVPTAMLAYGNIVSVAFIVSDVKDSNKTIPIAVFVAMSIVAFLYCLVISSTLGLVNSAYLAENPGMRMIPLYASCFTKLYEYGFLVKVISIAAVLALITTMLIVIAITSRMLEAVSNDGLISHAFGKVNKNGVPFFSSFIVSAASAAIACFPKFTEIIVNFGALFGALTISINIVSLIKTRKDKLSSSFVCPGGKALPYIVLALIIACYIPDITSGWQIWACTLAWYVLGSIVYLSIKKRKGE